MASATVMLDTGPGLPSLPSGLAEKPGQFNKTDSYKTHHQSSVTMSLSPVYSGQVSQSHLPKTRSASVAGTLNFVPSYQAQPGSATRNAKAARVTGDSSLNILPIGNQAPPRMLGEKNYGDAPIVETVSPGPRRRRWTSAIVTPLPAAGEYDEAAGQDTPRKKSGNIFLGQNLRHFSAPQTVGLKGNKLTSKASHVFSRFSREHSDGERPTRRRFTIDTGPSSAATQFSKSCDVNCNQLATEIDSPPANRSNSCFTDSAREEVLFSTAQVNAATALRQGLALFPGESINYIVKKCSLSIRLGYNVVRGGGTLYVTDRRAVLTNTGDDIDLDGDSTLATLTLALSALPKKTLLSLPVWLRPRKKNLVCGSFSWRGQMIQYTLTLGVLSG